MTDNTWKELQSEITRATNDVRFAGIVISPNDTLIERIGITENSTLGAIIKYTCGISVRNGFLRIFGGKSCETIEAIENWNNFPGSIYKDHLPGECIIFAYDLLGGFYAINGGYFGSELGKVFYFAPDSLNWENMKMGHSQFISWCFQRNIAGYYENFSWNDSQEMINEIQAGFGIFSYPFLWAKEGKDLNKTYKKSVPLLEIWNTNMSMKMQFDGKSGKA